MAVLTVSKEVPEMGGTSGYGRRVGWGGDGGDGEVEVEEGWWRF